MGRSDAWGWLRRTHGLNLRLERGFLLFALVEVLFAQAVSWAAFRQRASAREILGIAILTGGVALLIRAH